MLYIVLLACICSLFGCTLTGAIIGSVRDHNTADFDTFMTNQLTGFDSKDDVLLARKDGRTKKGEFAGIEKAPADGYARTYDAFLLQNANAMQLPRLGDSVFAVASGKRIGPFKFKGFDYDGTWLERLDSSAFPFHGSIAFKGQIPPPDKPTLETSPLCQA